MIDITDLFKTKVDYMPLDNEEAAQAIYEFANMIREVRQREKETRVKIGMDCVYEMACLQLAKKNMTSSEKISVDMKVKNLMRMYKETLK
jgi:hypothetical protein